MHHAERMPNPVIHRNVRNTNWDLHEKCIKKNLNSKLPLIPKYLAELNDTVDHVTTSLNHSLESACPKPRYEEIT